MFWGRGRGGEAANPANFASGNTQYELTQASTLPGQGVSPRHIERNRTVEDLLKNNKTCPEESIYQIGTMGESVPPDTLFSIVNEFYEEFERRFGSHIHILDWALHS